MVKSTSESLSRKNILVIGAARQGLAATCYLLSLGAKVTINDQRADIELQNTLKSIAERFEPGQLFTVLGQGHPIELLDGIDLVCLSGGIPLTLPLVQEAIKRKIPLTNDSQLLMEAVPCKVIGITGSAGKTTTTTLVGRMLKAWEGKPDCPYRKIWIGGNIGNPLIEQVGLMTPQDLVVLELSSFQLDIMTISPNISAVLNISPNHLDRHGTMEAYTAAKANILTHQDQTGWAILNREDAGSWSLFPIVKGKVATFGIEKPGESQQVEAAFFVEKDNIKLGHGNEVANVMSKSAIQLRGQHNLYNVLAACTVAYAAGASFEVMHSGVEGFGGVAHRLEFVRRINGADWYNDSIATAPERTLAAIRSFDQPLVLLLGGRDKNLDWQPLTKTILLRAEGSGIRHIVLFGETIEKIIQSFHQSGKELNLPIKENKHGSIKPNSLIVGNAAITSFDSLEEAVRFAATITQPGDVVLLSPGGTSFDAFRDFEERGEYFRKWVNQL